MTVDSTPTALILYYSRSGNTKRLAKAAEAALTEKKWQVNRMSLSRAVAAQDLGSPSLLIVGVPVQYWTVPQSASEMIRRLPRFKNCAAFVYACYGGCVAHNVTYTLAGLVSAKGAAVMGGALMLTPHSCRQNGAGRLGDKEPNFGKGHPDDNEQRAFQEGIVAVADKAAAGITGPIAPDRLKIGTSSVLTAAVSPLAPLKLRRMFMPAVSTLPEKCAGCEACASVCDTGSIAILNGGTAVIDPATCRKCYGCIEACPESALTTDWRRAERVVRLMQAVAREPQTIIAI